MRILDPGHYYEFTVLDGDEAQDIRFVKREGDGYPGNVGHYSGTTSQEVLRALIDRGEYVNRQIPCAETEAATELMRGALLLLEMRAARRHGRHLDITTTHDLEDAPVCHKCGHVGCSGACR